jgi:uncharacterized membrane protein YphA (DoxX/SURF4 family)
MTPKTRAARIGLEVALWALTALLVMVFVRAGVAKFDPASGWATAFAHWGYPVWFRVSIGILEVAAAALLLWPRSAAYGAILIIAVMLGGMGTHVFIEHRPSRVTSELGQLAFASVVLAGRWQSRIGPGTPAARASP